jgi:type I restriction enzyme S subunit
MLQPAPAPGADKALPYLRAGSLASLPAVDDLPTMFASDRDLRVFGVRSGDLVVAEGGDVGRAEFLPNLPTPTIIQNSLHRVRPKAGVADVRYLKYCLDAVNFSGWLEVLCNKSTFGHLTREKLRALDVPVRTLSEQRGIADFLDTATSRIDALMTKKRLMAQLVAEQASSVMVQALAWAGFTFPESINPNWAEKGLPKGWRVVHLSQSLRELTNGYVGPTRDILRDEGVMYVQSLHIKGGKIDFHRHPFFVDRTWHAARRRIHLREGDVLIVQTGDIGQVAVVPKGFGDASCHALQIARVRPDLISGRFLGEYLRTPFGYQSLLSRATGALHPHLEGGIRDVPVVVPPLGLQEELVADVEKQRQRLGRLDEALRKQLDLLVSHRQTLVVSALTSNVQEVEVAV